MDKSFLRVSKANLKMLLDFKSIVKRAQIERGNIDVELQIQSEAKFQEKLIKN